MIIAATADTVRDLERRTMITTGDDALMQRAAAGLAAVLMAELRRRAGRLYGTAVTVLVGPGNNGGDALFAGARLAARGVAFELVLAGDGEMRSPIEKRLVLLKLLPVLWQKESRSTKQ